MPSSGRRGGGGAIVCKNRKGTAALPSPMGRIRAPTAAGHNPSPPKAELPLHKGASCGVALVAGALHLRNLHCRGLLPPLAWSPSLPEGGNRKPTSATLTFLCCKDKSVLDRIPKGKATWASLREGGGPRLAVEGAIVCKNRRARATFSAGVNPRPTRDCLRGVCPHLGVRKYAFVLLRCLHSPRKQ